MPRMNTDAMTWTALLSKWVEFAQSSLALPDDTEGHRWRQSVAPIITLQAVRFALDELDRLPRDERVYGIDKAGVLIEDAVDELINIWYGKGLPRMIEEIGEDTLNALERAGWIGMKELIWRGSEPLVIPGIEIDTLVDEIGQSERATFIIAQPGTYIMPDEPFAVWCGFDDEARVERAMLARFPGSEITSRTLPRQVYRCIDDQGRILGDVMTHFEDEVDIRGGLPLLIPILDFGHKVLDEFTLDALEWEEAQRAQLRQGGLEMHDRTADDDIRNEQ